MPFVATSILALCAAFGAWLDVIDRRLPNWLCLVTALTGLALAFAGGGAGALGSAALHGALALAVGMALFGFGWIGGGDAKFYAACAAWFPLTAGFHLVGAISLAGLAVVAVWMLYRHFMRARTPDETSVQATVPYGVAIAVGAILLKAVAP